MYAHLFKANRVDCNVGTRVKIVAIGYYALE